MKLAFVSISAIAIFACPYAHSEQSAEQQTLQTIRTVKVKSGTLNERSKKLVQERYGKVIDDIPIGPVRVAVDPEAGDFAGSAVQSSSTKQSSGSTLLKLICIGLFLSVTAIVAVRWVLRPKVDEAGLLMKGLAARLKKHD
jgi:hypothetical protein